MKRKKITKIIIGTNNLGKLKEIRDLLPNNLTTFSPKDLKFKSPRENGKSFKENSIIKAKYFSKKSKMICIADDSGLEIDTLNKKPGIFSSRWGGSKSNFNLAMNKVFKELNSHLYWVALSGGEITLVKYFDELLRDSYSGISCNHKQINNKNYFGSFCRCNWKKRY